jgi:hypothetical protein
MPLFTRGARVAALAACVLLTGCGGSVADADSAPARTTRQAAPSASPFCAASRANSAAIGPLNTLVSAGNPTPQELSRAVEAVRRAGAELQTVAPPEVRDDVQLTVEAVDAQLDALLAHGGDGRAVSNDPAVAARLASPELTAASERLAGYISRTCAAATQR